MLKSQIYLDSNAPPLALLLAFVDTFGTEALEWDSQLIRNEITNPFKEEIENA